MLRASCHTLEINEFRCYEVKRRIVGTGGCPAVVAKWQSTGGSSQRCPGFDSRRLPAFSLSSIFAS